MSHFAFKAKKPSGEVYSAEKDAADHYELYKLIRSDGDEVVEWKEKSSSRIRAKKSLADSALFGYVNMMERINFARNLGSMLAAGLALSKALVVLHTQTKNKAMKSVLDDVIEEINKGSSLSGALDRHPRVFSKIFVAMVNAGEQSGTLSESLKVVAAQMDSTYALERRVRGALVYPSVIITVMVLIGVLMLIFVVPSLVKTFTDLHVALPLTTRILIGVADLVKHQGILLISIIAMVVIALYWWSGKSLGKYLIQAVVLRMPIIGELVKEVNTARTARTLSSLLTSGVGVVESASITKTVVQNVHFKSILDRAIESVRKGGQMSKVFAENDRLYPAFFSEMVNVGEETGKTGEMLLGVANYYEEDVDMKTKNMSTIIEPILIVVIGAAVAFFALSMITPLYSLVNAL